MNGNLEVCVPEVDREHGVPRKNRLKDRWYRLHVKLDEQDKLEKSSWLGRKGRWAELDRPEKQVRWRDNLGWRSWWRWPNAPRTSMNQAGRRNRWAWKSSRRAARRMNWQKFLKFRPHFSLCNTIRQSKMLPLPLLAWFRRRRSHWRPKKTRQYYWGGRRIRYPAGFNISSNSGHHSRVKWRRKAYQRHWHPWMVKTQRKKKRF